jgi:hypothetical protein
MTFDLTHLRTANTDLSIEYSTITIPDAAWMIAVWISYPYVEETMIDSTAINLKPSLRSRSQ